MGAGFVEDFWLLSECDELGYPAGDEPLFAQVMLDQTVNHVVEAAFGMWMFSASWCYDLYLLLRDGVYPLTWEANIYAPSVMYFFHFASLISIKMTRFHYGNFVLIFLQLINTGLNLFA
ncbi:hypothetical protein H8L32_11490 [Undibacterium sp. CY18W]|uniref:Uncharacterized protein n=1 Tax=Undibacterium hunanense TaxID=2762292 RepID=A0ABR6ZQE2_9BURK|nr:hypothetical protein [Undibacterium hunanense]MBC3918102.1 hypothetical protein [Undibacterium hunanense]